MAIHSDRAHARARELRRSPTSTEKVLWKHLRGKQLDGLRFRRQAPISPYVADFCCLSHRLVVEVDGGIHAITEDADARRDAWLTGQGFTVLRFRNNEVLDRPDEVFARIRAAARVYTPHPSRSASHLPPQGGKGMSAEIWFYHLERSTLDQVLPELLDRTLQKGWRAQVRISDPVLMEQVDERLWLWRDDAFLAHGRADQPHAERQPILLTAQAANPNGAQALFIVDRSDMDASEPFERCFIIFDGRDEESLHHARERWKALKQAGANLAYWKQTEQGRWEKAA